jgi:hypothetical protein
MFRVQSALSSDDWIVLYPDGRNGGVRMTLWIGDLQQPPFLLTRYTAHALVAALCDFYKFGPLDVIEEPHVPKVTGFLEE